MISRASGRMIVSAAVLVAVACGLSHIGIINVGLPFGYYAELNKVRARLRALPNVTIRGVRENHDITLEDFTVDITVDDRYDVSLYFSEPPSPSWELFDEADALFISYQETGSGDARQETRHRWRFPLGPDDALEAELGCRMRDADDVLTNLSHIMHLIETTSVDELYAKYSPNEAPPTQACLSLGVREVSRGGG